MPSCKCFASGGSESTSNRERASESSSSSPSSFPSPCLFLLLLIFVHQQKTYHSSTVALQRVRGEKSVFNPQAERDALVQHSWHAFSYFLRSFRPRHSLEPYLSFSAPRPSVCWTCATLKLRPEWQRGGEKCSRVAKYQWAISNPLTRPSWSKQVTFGLDGPSGTRIRRFNGKSKCHLTGLLSQFGILLQTKATRTSLVSSSHSSPYSRRIQASAVRCQCPICNLEQLATIANCLKLP